MVDFFVVFRDNEMQGLFSLGMMGAHVAQNKSQFFFLPFLISRCFFPLVVFGCWMLVCLFCAALLRFPPSGARTAHNNKAMTLYSCLCVDFIQCVRVPLHVHRLYILHIFIYNMNHSELLALLLKMVMKMVMKYSHG